MTIGAKTWKEVDYPTIILIAIAFSHYHFPEVSKGDFLHIQKM